MSIALAPYPQYSHDATDLIAEREVQLLQDIIGAARDLRADMKLDPKLPLSGTLYARGVAVEVAYRTPTRSGKLANVTLEFRQDGAPPPRARCGRRTNSIWRWRLRRRRPARIASAWRRRRNSSKR